MLSSNMHTIRVVAPKSYIVLGCIERQFVYIGQCPAACSFFLMDI